MTKKEERQSSITRVNQSSTYDILEDLKLSKDLRRPVRPRIISKRKTMVEQKLRTTSAWCEAKIGNAPIDLIIDTGASGCVVSHEFLKK